MLDDRTRSAVMRLRPRSATARIRQKSKQPKTKKKAQRKRPSSARVVRRSRPRRHPRLDDIAHIRQPEWMLIGRTKFDDPFDFDSHRSPGPKYRPDSSFIMPGHSGQPKWSMGEKIKEHETVRSPGHVYNPTHTAVFQNYGSFSLMPRRPIKKHRTVTPAPGEHFRQSSFLFRCGSTRGCTLKGTHMKSSTHHASTPGPASYNISRSRRKQRVRGGKMGKKLPGMAEGFVKDTPGPAKYVPNIGNTLHQSSRWSMGSRTKLLIPENKCPGPKYGPSTCPPTLKKKKKKKRIRKSTTKFKPKPTLGRLLKYKTI